MIQTDGCVRDYEVCPRLVPADREAAVRVRPRAEHGRFDRAAKLHVKLFPVSGLCSTGKYADDPEPTLQWRLEEDGSLLIRAFFAGEQEFTLLVTAEEFGHPQGAKSPRKEMRFGLYSLRPDLYGRVPLRGDLHMHSNRSDGEAAPEAMAAQGRKIGLDFLAVTDHHQYRPSLQCIAALKDVPTGLLLFSGEEVQLPGTPVHILDFGGDFSVNEWVDQHPDAYRQEVAALLRAHPVVRNDMEAFPVGAADWTFRKIREVNGVSVFCHCFWQREHYMLDEAVTREILARREFDAMEAVSGHGIVNWWSNNLQSVLASEESGGGEKFSIVGTSDSHSLDGPNEFGCTCTFAFPERAEHGSILDALRNGWCVAAEEQTGEIPRFYGAFRLVRYAAFLRKHWFPRHDELCHAEGTLLQEVFAGRPEMLPAVKLVADAVRAYRESLVKPFNEAR